MALGCQRVTICSSGMMRADIIMKRVGEWIRDEKVEAICIDSRMFGNSEVRGLEFLASVGEDMTFFYRWQMRKPVYRGERAVGKERLMKHWRNSIMWDAKSLSRWQMVHPPWIEKGSFPPRCQREGKDENMNVWMSIWWGGKQRSMSVSGKVLGYKQTRWLRRQ